jgi:hypothetical protein
MLSGCKRAPALTAFAHYELRSKLYGGTITCVVWMRVNYPHQSTATAIFCRSRAQVLANGIAKADSETTRPLLRAGV